MEAQSTRLSTIAGDIANASTSGYKAAEAQFSTLVGDAQQRMSFDSGGVETTVRYGISRQGVLQDTGSKFDLGVSGDGFMLVADPSGEVLLTRAGGFVPNGEGQLVNAAGYVLLGMPLSGGGGDVPVVNGTAGLTPVTVSSDELAAEATTAGRLSVNLPSSADVVPAGNLPSANSGTSAASARSSLIVYDSLGGERTIDLQFARTSVPGEWEVAAFDAAGRAASGSFPYAAGALARTTISFDAEGQLTSSSPRLLSIPVPGGATMSLDLSGTTQLAAGFVVISAGADGNPAAASGTLQIGEDGTVTRSFSNGTLRPLYRVPLATVTSPDRLAVLSGNAYQVSPGSGDLRIDYPQSGGLGTLVSGSLEASTVDLSSELTDMIEAQRNYTANSRVFQTGSEIMDIIVNLKR